MASPDSSGELMALAFTLLLLLLFANRAFDFHTPLDNKDDNDPFDSISESSQQSSLDVEVVTRFVFLTFHLCNILYLFGDNLIY